MAKYKSYDYSQNVLIPVSLEGQLMPGTLEFAIHTLVETRIDTSTFDRRYRNDETGRWAYDPKILLKVVLLGYSRGLLVDLKIWPRCTGSCLSPKLTRKLSSRLAVLFHLVLSLFVASFVTFVASSFVASS